MEDIKPLIGLTLEGLRHVVAEQGLPAFTAKQIARRLYVGRVTSLDEITELSKKARAALTEAGYAVGLEKPLSAVKSTDGTKKYLFRGLSLIHI